MSLIHVANLTFSYDGSYDIIFENVSFQIDTDWKLGLIGRNGRGKTTFLNLLFGKYEYQGDIFRSVNFDYFPFEVSNKTESTLDVIALIYPDFALWKIKKEFFLLEVCESVLYRQFDTLSQGEQTKVLLAILFLKPNVFLLIDEPTNHLDETARIIVGNYLKSKKGFIVVSHDRYFLDHCIDHVLSINKSNIEVQHGNFSSWWYNKTVRDQFEITENEKLQKQIKHLSKASKQTANWSDKVELTKYGTRGVDKGYIGHKAAKMMKRSKAIQNRKALAVAEKSKLLKNIEQTSELAIHPMVYHTNQLATLKDISIFYMQNKICHDVNFTIKQGDRIALRGKNGCGKSSILKLILGEKIDHLGTITVGNHLIISYVSQDTSFLNGTLEELANASCIDLTLFKSILIKLDFNQIHLEKKIETLSEGQKKKVSIAKSLCQQAHLYLWDEPLNFIDVISRIQIENLIDQYKPTLLFVEHDTTFCEKIATKMIIL